MSDLSQASIFLSFEGIPGAVELPAQSVPPGPSKDWTPLQACNFSATVNVQGRAISGGGSSRIDLGGDAPPVRISKTTDSATVGLMREMLAGTSPRRAVIVFVRTDTDGPAEYLRFELDECWIVAFTMTGFGDDRAAEEFALLYKQLTLITFAGGHGAKGAQSSAILQNGS